MKFTLALSLTLFFPPVSRAESVRVESALGIAAQLDPSSGHYEITVKEPGWSFAGELGHPAQNAAAVRGTDRLGAFQEIRFRLQEAMPLSVSIRVYDGRPVVLFLLSCDRAADTLPTMLPRFTTVPAGLHCFSHKDAVFAPPSFTAEEAGTPWLVFDDRANAAVISPADHFLIAAMAGDGVHEIASGLSSGVRGLPARFTSRTIMAFGRGIGATWDSWGKALTDLQGKVRPANDADVGLRYLGYWTDNGAVYYYNYDLALGYAGTLEALVKHYRERGIPIRYLQLDSWWYYKTLTDPDGKPGRSKNGNLPEGEWNRYGGLLKYEAHPGVFPAGLAVFQKKIGLPLITHNRWIDPASPYHGNYQISGYAAIDPHWWHHIFDYLGAGGVVGYEQDWLSVIYQHSSALKTTVSTGDAFTDGMAKAASDKGMSLQYCMALPRFFLQSSRYSNLTTIRVSDDRFKRDRWDKFLYNSQFARALGVWPWSDVFMSTETDNLLLATLSAGMVGPGDAIGRENKENLLRAARPDGVLVKPDVPIVPLDEVYVADANNQQKPMVAWTHTDHGALRTAYVFAYNRQQADAEAGFTPTALGFKGTVCVLDERAGTAQRQPAEKRFAFILSAQAAAYYLVVPVGRSGVAFFGDEGKFVSNGRKRIAALQDAPNRLIVTVTFTAGEKSVRLVGCAERAPQVVARRGSAGEVSFDASSGRFSVEARPAPGVTRETPGGDPIQTAIIEFNNTRGTGLRGIR